MYVKYFRNIGLTLTALIFFSALECAAPVSPGTAKDIVLFVFTKALNPMLSSDVVATINGATIVVVVPAKTPLIALKPTLVHNGVSVYPTGGIARDFTNKENYTVTAEDGSTQDYSVVVSSESEGTNDVTSFVFLKADNTILASDITGIVTSSSVFVSVPMSIVVTDLKPTITQNGKGVSPASKVTQNFTNKVSYMVTAQNGAEKIYGINVVKVRDGSYLVPFDTDGGSEVPFQLLSGGGIVSKPTTPVRHFFRFVDWYKDPSRKMIFNFETEKIKETTVIYAKWEVIVPSVPTGMTAIAVSLTQINVSWSEVMGATKYQLYDGEVRFTASITTNSYSHFVSYASSHEYSVKACNDVECSAASEKVNATTAITIMSHPYSVSVESGSTATFTVATDVNYPLLYQWQKADVFSNIFNDISGPGARNISYTTPLLKMSDTETQYRVVISNRVISNAATLTVK